VPRSPATACSTVFPYIKNTLQKIKKIKLNKRKKLEKVMYLTPGAGQVNLSN
jgi:hypothetical protein